MDKLKFLSISLCLFCLAATAMGQGEGTAPTTDQGGGLIIQDADGDDAPAPKTAKPADCPPTEVPAKVPDSGGPSVEDAELHEEAESPSEAANRQLAAASNARQQAAQTGEDASRLYQSAIAEGKSARAAANKALRTAQSLLRRIQNVENGQKKMAEDTKKELANFKKLLTAEIDKLLEGKASAADMEDAQRSINYMEPKVKLLTDMKIGKQLQEIRAQLTAIELMALVGGIAGGLSMVCWILFVVRKLFTKKAAPAATVPTITRLSPNTGAVGAVVTIRFKNIAGNEAVFFGGVQVATVTYFASGVTVEVPPGHNPGDIVDVTVVNAAGMSNALQFTYA